jgi:hypothetical protein
MSEKQMNLGQLIDALERKDATKEVVFDFAHFRPCGVHSWRGDYSHLAIGYTSDYRRGENITVGQLLDTLRDADGKEFTGWKGGEFIMDRDTPVWVAENGETGNTGIADVEDTGIYVVLNTWRFDY